MASREVPGLGLKAFWDLYETSWKTGMDENLWNLSVLVQTRIIDFVETEPSSPEHGDIYVITDGEFANHLVVFDVDLWVPVVPFDGQLIYNSNDKEVYKYDTADGWVPLVSPERVKSIYESNANTNAFTDAEKTKLSGIENNATADMSNAEIKIAYEANTNTNAFTDAEKVKLANLSASRFLGVYPTLTALRAAHPAPSEGSFAYVDQGPSTDIMSYIWDVNDLKYVPQASGNTQETPESVKVKYEANDDTNAFTDYEKELIATFPDLISGKMNADAEIPWTQITDAPPSFSGSWNDLTEKPSTFPPSAHAHDAATTDANGFMSSGDKTKLNGIAEGAQVNPTGADVVSLLDTHLEGTVWRDAPVKVLPINTQAGAYTVALTDASGYVRMTSATEVNLTVPPNATVAFPIGSVIQVRQAGAGQVTVVEGSGVTVTSSESKKFRKQGSTIALIKVATDTWDMTGDLEAL